MSLKLNNIRAAEMFEKPGKDNGRMMTVNVPKVGEANSKASKVTGEFEGQETKWLIRRFLEEAHKLGVYQTLNQSERTKKCPWNGISKSIWCPG
jgi:hypothetical protein